MGRGVRRSNGVEVWRPRVAFAVASVVALVALSTGAKSSVAGAASAGCSDPGLRVPVVLVHGFNTQRADWPAITKALSAEPDLTVTKFDYTAESLEWVTNANIGPRLADLIACLGDYSRLAGGPGKVIVVAHSMGGLATRFAGAQSRNGTLVGDRIGLVLTIGTPNSGSLAAAAISGDLNPLVLDSSVLMAELDAACADVRYWTRFRSACDYRTPVGAPATTAMQPGSAELAALAAPNPNETVHAFAGQVRLVAHLWHWSGPIGDLGDLIVGVPSATAYPSPPDAHTDDGGGVTVHTCDVGFDALASTQPDFQAIVNAYNGCAHWLLPEVPEIVESVRQLAADWAKRHLVAPCTRAAVDAATGDRGWETPQGLNETGPFCRDGWAVTGVAPPEGVVRQGWYTVFRAGGPRWHVVSWGTNGVGKEDGFTGPVADDLLKQLDRAASGIVDCPSAARDAAVADPLSNMEWQVNELWCLSDGWAAGWIAPKPIPGELTAPGLTTQVVLHQTAGVWKDVAGWQGVATEADIANVPTTVRRRLGVELNGDTFSLRNPS